MPTATPTTWIVAGATGATGREAVSLLADAGHKVVALTRRAVGLEVFPRMTDESSRLVDVKVVDFGDLAAITAAIADSGATAVLSAVGTSRMNEEVAKAMKSDGDDAGFEQWLDTVDLGYSKILAEATATVGRVSYFGRISAIVLRKVFEDIKFILK